MATLNFTRMKTSVLIEILLKISSILNLFIFFSNSSIDSEINAIQKNLTKEQIETVINSLDTISDQNLITSTTSENPALNLLEEESTQELDTNKTSKMKPKRKTKI